MKTSLLYLTEMHRYECEAVVVSVTVEDGVIVVVLDQTNFYPQGGGQPSGIGVITCSESDARFAVSSVRIHDDIVAHTGVMTHGELRVGMSVTCVVDKDRRELHTRLHSAGHLIDIAVKELGLPWMPGKGYHFPDGAYIEYTGDIDGINVPQLIVNLENKISNVQSRRIVTRVEFDETLAKQGSSHRKVYYGDVGIPCGGTHVAQLSDVGAVNIRKIKQEKGKVRVGYAL